MVFPDCSERTILLTGGTRGIGRAAARKLGELGATLLLVGRDAERGEATTERLRRKGVDAEFLRYDLAEQAAVRDLAATVRDRVDDLDALVNNAGLARSSRSRTADGIPVTVAVNHLAPYLLTHELLPLLLDGEPARVVVTSSGVHEGASLDPDDLDLRGDYEGFDGYARTKLMNVLFVYELADRLHGTEVTATAFHPGFIPSSSLYRDSAFYVRAAMRLLSILPVGSTVEDGAEALTYLTCSEDVAGVTGQYFDGTEPAEPSADAHDERLRRALWTESAELVGVEPDWPRVEREI
ncbi:SDR family NAD(P)-dependent oxidoreductase [Halostella sp. JP-L12]|uniref:SDR family NAD(P)-dependent oxidoreductase n=1 Tax=Halostella TaxID=1843185 RepID=UPI000EF765E4|nr:MULTISPECIES: SDR family NAD(P)-dependent oxidoreductase [Halostella]NHN46857.1 SDR family NAD(P)-dependent oxidoreductase [Halostella sp. JP-L12]